MVYLSKLYLQQFFFKLTFKTNIAEKLLDITEKLLNKFV